MFDLRQPFPVLSCRMACPQLEGFIAHLFFSKAKAGQRMPEFDLFGYVSHPGPLH
jgi:hypothetical protein